MSAKAPTLTPEELAEAVRIAQEEADTDAGPWDSPVNIAEMMNAKPDPMPWLFTQRIPAGRGTLLTGLGGSSKTTVLYAMAVGACCGFLPWSWEVERTGKAVLLLTEDTAFDVHQTIFYLARDLSDTDRATITKNLIIYPLAGKDTRLMTKTRAGTVEKSPLFHSLESKINNLGGVVFVGLDPALSLTEGDEMDQGQQRALGKMADDLGVNTGAAVVLVSHSTKGSLQTEEPQSHSSRGGGAVTDAVRGEYVLRNMTPKEAAKANITDAEERHRHVQLVGTKGNKIPPAGKVPVWLRRDNYGNLAEVEISMDGAGTVTTRDRDILRVLQDLEFSGPVKLSDWRVECLKRGLLTGPTDNARKQAMKKTITKLSTLGMIEKPTQGFYATIDDEDANG
jgi:RecA-family ATPase